MAYSFGRNYLWWKLKRKTILFMDKCLHRIRGNSSHRHLCVQRDDPLSPEAERAVPWKPAMRHGDGNSTSISAAVRFSGKLLGSSTSHFPRRPYHSGYVRKRSSWFRAWRLESARFSGFYFITE